MKIINLLIYILLATPIFAMTTINIHVSDKDGNPVPNAKVEVKGVMQWDKDDFCRTYDIDFYDCFAPKGFANPDWQDTCLEKDVCVEAFLEGLKECGYYEDLETWIAQMHEREGRYKYEDINTDINTDVNGMAHVEVDGYAEYRVAVQGAVRYFKDGVKDISMSVKAGEVIYWVMPIDDFGDFRHFCNIREDGLRRLWNVFVVKSNPYLDIRKHFPNNDTLLQPEDILKYYPEIHDIRVWNEESYDENLLTFCGDLNEQWNSSDQKERALFLHLEQGEYQFIFSSDNGEIFIDELNTRTASNIWHRFMWEKFPDERWLLHYYVRFDPNYKTKTPPDNIQIPTVITPYTQDGLNDDFLPGYEVEIFDYYGNFVCSSANGWDGRKGSDLATPGIYFYKVKLKDGRKRKGTVEVIKM